MMRSIESLRVERLYRNVIDTFLAGRLPNFTHERHVHVANVPHHLPYGRELMHLGLQTMAHRHGIPGEIPAGYHRHVVGSPRRHPPRTGPLCRSPWWRERRSGVTRNWRSRTAAIRSAQPMSESSDTGQLVGLLLVAGILYVLFVLWLWR
jgi:hypothetical protein